MAAVEADVARPPAEVIGSDVLPLVEACRFLEKHARAILKPRNVKNAPLFLLGQKDIVHRRPYGTVGIIGTWNYPILLNGVQLLQALVAGNGVLWKPSELGARSAAVMHRLLLDAGFPSGLVQLLPAERDAGPQLLETDIDFLVFTGSSAVGRKIAQRLADRLIPSALELSGVDAMFVLNDADVKLAAKAAWFGVTLNRGQTCLAVRRLFVQRGIRDAFVNAITPLIERTGAQSLVMAGQVHQIEQLQTDAIARGGQILSAKKPAESQLTNASLPALVLNGSPDMEVCQMECFGPLAALMTFDSIDDALTLEARCRYALGASIFSADRAAAEALASRLRAGSVSINDVIAPTAHPATPFGGSGASGWGTTQGVEGLLAMTVPQAVSYRGGKFRPHFDGATPALANTLHGMLQWRAAASFSRRWSGLWQMLNGMRTMGREPPTEVADAIGKKTPGRDGARPGSPLPKHTRP